MPASVRHAASHGCRVAAHACCALVIKFCVPCGFAQNNKDYFDQSLDEIKLLRYANEADPQDTSGVLRLYDYFYFKVRSEKRCV